MFIIPGYVTNFELYNIIQCSLIKLSRVSKIKPIIYDYWAWNDKHPCSFMTEKVKYWIDISDYDQETAQAMLDSKRYLYVGFMCHQSIEKILKAYYEFIHNDTPPYTHQLIYLSELTGLIEIMSDEQKNYLDFLEPLNIEARYPGYKNKIFKLLTKEICEKLLIETNEFQKWIKEKLQRN